MTTAELFESYTATLQQASMDMDNRHIEERATVNEHGWDQMMSERGLR